MRAGDSNTPQNITTHPAASKAASPLTISARSTLRPRSVPTFAVKHRIGRGFAFSVPAKNAAGEGIASPAPATFRRILRISSAAPAMMQIKLPKNLEINTRTRAAHNQCIADLIAGREIKPPRYGKLAAARPTAAAVPKVMEDAGPPRPTTRNRQRAGQALASRRCYTQQRGSPSRRLATDRHRKSGGSMRAGYGSGFQIRRLAVTGPPYRRSGVQNAVALGGGVLLPVYWQTYSVADSTMFKSSSSYWIATVSMREK